MCGLLWGCEQLTHLFLEMSDLVDTKEMHRTCAKKKNNTSI